MQLLGRRWQHGLAISVALAVSCAAPAAPPPIETGFPESPAAGGARADEGTPGRDGFAWSHTDPTVPELPAPRAAWKPEAWDRAGSPGSLDWTEAAAWLPVLPVPLAEELIVDGQPIAYLERDLRALLRWRAPAAPPGANEPWWSGRPLAELLQVFRSARTDPARTQALLEELVEGVEGEAPWAAAYLEPLLLTSFLFDPDWHPRRSESTAGATDDGILEGSTFSIRGDPERPWPWREPGRDRDCLQAATLVFGDLSALERVTLDFARRMEDRGFQNLDTFPLANSYRKGLHPNGAPFTVCQSFHHKDLGMFFGKLAYVLQNIGHYSAEGWPVLASFALDDRFPDTKGMAWMYSRETYMPIRTRAGEVVATLVVVTSSFDIEELWEADTHRREAVRERLGNLKRSVEGDG